MADIVLSVASKVAKYLVAPVCRHSSYVIFSGSYIGQLKEEIEKLENATQRVQLSINEARQEMKLIKAHPEQWVTEMKTVLDKGKQLEHKEIAKKTYFCRWLPNLKERYRLSRDVRRKVREIQEHILRGRFEMDYCNHAPSGHVVGALNVDSSADHWGDTIIESRASILEKIMNTLDDEKLKVTGIYGCDGVGKTTLLEEVEKKLKSERRLFDVIAKAKVSQTPLKKIQDGIAYAFGLNLKDELSEEGRRDRLFREIQSDPTKKVLIILEDLSGVLDLKAVGIPSRYESRGCKLLLTSSFKNVLEQEMDADRTIHLEGLNNKEAFKLFEKIVRDRLKDEKLKPIAAKVVKKLAGLPLLITSVASTLKYSNMFVWINVLTKIGGSNIDAIAKFCYNNLKSEDAKSLFLLCGLIGGTIRVETLLVLGMGLGLFEGSLKRIEGSREKLNTFLDSLRSVCLLLDGGDDKENVTIHDLYCKAVVSTPFTGEDSLVMNSSYYSWSKEKLAKCWAIYLVNTVNGGLAELMSCQFINLKILMLSQPEDWLGSPAHRHDERHCCRLDFTCMKDLQVLYLRSMHITTLSSSIEILKDLRSLFLDNCLVEDVAILGKLKALQFLSFAGSAISRLPTEMGELKNLRLLNLSNCKKLQIIEPGVLKSLVNLEELYMKGSFDRWVSPDEIPSKSCNAGLAELRSLTKLTILEISILDPAVILEGNSIRKRISEVNSVQEKRILEACDKEKKKLEEDGSNKIKRILEAYDRKKKKLEEDGSNKIKGILEAYDRKKKRLEEDGFDEIEEISKPYEHDDSTKKREISEVDLQEKISEVNSVQQEKISEVNSVQQEKLSVACDQVKKQLEEEGSAQIKKILEDYDQTFGNLIRFWINIGNLDGREFEGLRTMKLKLEGCDNIFSIEWVQKILQKTQYLHVDGLQKFKNVQDICTRGFRELKHLDIDNSPSIKYIINSSINLLPTTFTILESLFLKNLIDLNKICNGPMAPECFSKLKAVRIEKCHQLKDLWLLSEMQRLVHLEEIQVHECDSMQAIIPNDAGKVEVADEIVELPNVRRLDLQKLGNMRSFSTRGEGAAFQVPFLFSPHISLSFCKYMSFLYS
ncbi:hypothetical protein ACJRO7_027445 [Eucalyptus globulus]|uniref:NB-ARC domain-containing protein n=1 Tax=Eucalyptus globulus TaxID=34317 RepID=A0ABD3JTQ1_EUCGL